MPVISENPEFKIILANSQSGVIFGEVAPANMEAAIYIDDTGYVSFDLNLSHRLATKDKIEPYATDFVLMHKEHHIMGGIITAVGVDLDQRWLSVSGLDYTHYLDKRIWPFNPANPTANVYVKVGGDVFAILEEILDEVLAEPNSLEIMYDLGTSGITTNYRIEPGDTESILEKFRDMSEQSPGFDFEIMPNIQDGIITRELMVYSPEKGELKDYVLEQGKNIKILNYVNVGVTATDVFAFGAGTSLKVAARSFDLAARIKYRRMDHTIDLGDIIDTSMVQRASKAELDKILFNHQSDLRVTIVPEANFDVWAEIFVGDTVRVKADTEYERIDGNYRITAFEITQTETGDEEVAMVFQHEI